RGRARTRAQRIAARNGCEFLDPGAGARRRFVRHRHAPAGCGGLAAELAVDRVGEPDATSARERERELTVVEVLIEPHTVAVEEPPADPSYRPPPPHPGAA